jgi:hypothetical protein
LYASCDYGVTRYTLDLGYWLSPCLNLLVTLESKRECTIKLGSKTHDMGLISRQSSKKELVMRGIKIARNCNQQGAYFYRT